MSWIIKLAQCDWCEEEINALIDKVHESEKGTLCDNCEKGRLAEREIYAEKREEARIQREIDKATKDLTK